MIEKWEKHPFRVGMIAGFVVLPLLWIVQEYLLYFVFGFQSPFNFQLLNYFIAGAIQGAILGAGVSKAAFMGGGGNCSDVKWCLLSHGVTALVFSAILLFPSSNTIRFTLTYLPLHLALLMLMLGILMRSRR